MLADVEPEVRLKLERALAIEQQVTRQTREVIAEALVERIISHSLEPISDGVEEAVKVSLVLVIVEAPARLAELTALPIATRF